MFQLASVWSEAYPSRSSSVPEALFSPESVSFFEVPYNPAWLLPVEDVSTLRAGNHDRRPSVFGAEMKGGTIGGKRSVSGRQRLRPRLGEPFGSLLAQSS
ncbi:hypothetical protein B932_2533 [Gluconobacter oxydans H24]|nr:hypothetical protein B932_2533 [Gluconobacter oxydans H24]